MSGVVVNNRDLLVARQKSAIQQWLNQWLILTKSDLLPDHLLEV